MTLAEAHRYRLRVVRSLPIAALLATSAANAAPWTLGADVSYALLAGGGEARHGIALGGRAHFGLGERFMLGGVLHYALHPSGAGGTAHTAFVGGSFVWKLDVVEWVPFATFEAGALFHKVPGLPESGDFDLAFGLGVDYLLSREVALGFHARYHLIATGLSSFPAYVTAGFRVSYRWE